MRHKDKLQRNDFSIWKRIHGHSTFIDTEFFLDKLKDGHSPHIEVNEPKGYMLSVKRAFDIFASITLIIFLSPLLIAISMLVAVLIDFSVLYKEERIGLNGESFTFYKFRTMVKNANEVKDKLSNLNEMQGPFFKIKDDPRILELGKFLRKYSLDELPQLFNVLKGDMSLVGPRPCQPKEFENLLSWQRDTKTKMKPGITCIWQTSGRNLITNHNQWLLLDAEYINNWSFWLDIKLLLKTIPAVLSGIGAS